MTKAEREQRAERMKAMYSQGLTLTVIGEHFSLTPERVRQILSGLGCDAKSGGAAVKRSQREAIRMQRLDAQSLARWGVTFNEMKQHRQSGAIRAFQHQRRNADNRGVKFSLTFYQWWHIWQASGKWDQRGRGKGGYVMSRIKDSGGYEVGNVHIQSAVENGREAVNVWRGKTKTNKGVFNLYPGMANPWLARVGKVRVGYYPTEEAAVAARNEYIAAHPDCMTRKFSAGRGRGWTFDKRIKNGKQYMAQACGVGLGYFQTPEEAHAAYLAFHAQRNAEKKSEAH